MGNRRLIGAEMEGCQVRDWIVGEKDMSFSRILYMICVNGGYLVCELFITLIFNKSLAGNQRNVSMAAYGKLMVVSTLIEFGLVCFRDNIEQQTTWTTRLYSITRGN